MAAEDVRYRQSTQYRLWSFSPVQLASTREQTNALARSNISERLLSNPPPPLPAASLKPPPAAGAADPASGSNTPDRQAAVQQQQQHQQQTEPYTLPEFLTPAEELQLLNYYTVELLRAANHFNLRSPMLASAAVFLRRFYATNSVMTYPPAEMLKTCLFFGCKAEGYYPNNERFAQQFPKTKGEGILAGEFLLCQGIRFAFDVKHPFRGLEGAVLELRRYGDVDSTRINDASNRAKEILRFSPLVTDAYFHYTPSQIMLAALSLADQDLADRVLHETFHRPTQTEQKSYKSNSNSNSNSASASTSEQRAALVSTETRARVAEAVNACRDLLAKEPPERLTSYWDTPESNNIIKPLLKKLRKCRDPDRFNLVELQKAKREEALRREEAEERKAAGGEKKTVEADGSVFGEALGGEGGGGGGEGRDTKRRKTEGKGEDPFGGPLG
ncbi:cyclin ccl1 [Coniochaeta sp. 2T2.1]|nr:cyclin ccl1 [Coniochaeta sp. 2T2.1]